MVPDALATTGRPQGLPRRSSALCHDRPSADLEQNLKQDVSKRASHWDWYSFGIRVVIAFYCQEGGKHEFENTVQESLSWLMPRLWPSSCARV